MTKSSFQIRREKKLRRARRVVYLIIGVLLVASVGWLYIPLKVYLDDKERDRIANLDYPDPSSEINNRLIYTDHLDGINISTPWLTIKGEGTANTITLQLRTRIQGMSRTEVDITVSFDLAATGNLRLPADDWTHYPLTLTAKETIKIKSTPFTPGLIMIPSRNNPPSKYHDNMPFDIPTAFFLDAVNEGAVTFSIADYKCNLDSKTIDILKDFAATLKPNYQPPTSD